MKFVIPHRVERVRLVLKRNRICYNKKAQKRIKQRSKCWCSNASFSAAKTQHSELGGNEKEAYQGYQYSDSKNLVHSLQGGRYSTTPSVLKRLSFSVQLLLLSELSSLSIPRNLTHGAITTRNLECILVSFLHYNWRHLPCACSLVTQGKRVVCLCGFIKT